MVSNTLPLKRLLLRFCDSDGTVMVYDKTAQHSRQRIAYCFVTFVIGEAFITVSLSTSALFVNVDGEYIQRMCADCVRSTPVMAQ